VRHRLPAWTGVSSHRRQRRPGDGQGEPAAAARHLRDRLYIEIHTNSLEKQVKVNRHLEEFSRTYHIPPLAAVDSHYSVPEHRVIHQTWVAMQTGKTLADETTMFQGNQDYHLKTTEEVVEALIRQGFGDVFIQRR
jgi:DNA polymerase III alpha subunit